MTYVISDIHGRYDKYTAMLEKIKFSDNDTLYVLGDVIDRGEDGIKIILDILGRENAVMLLGNHEAMMLETLLEFTQITAGAISSLVVWFSNGGEPTFNEYMEITSAERIAVLGALEKMPYYTEVTVNGNNFLLLHAGLDNFAEDRALESYTRDEIVWAEPYFDQNFEQGYFDDVITIVGHTPTRLLCDCDPPKIFRAGNLIDIDCGCVFDGGRLGCLRLDDFEEFYV